MTDNLKNYLDLYKNFKLNDFSKKFSTDIFVLYIKNFLSFSDDKRIEMTQQEKQEYVESSGD